MPARRSSATIEPSITGGSDAVRKLKASRDPRTRPDRGMTMSMTATARRRGDTLEQEVDVNGRHMLVTDEPKRLGGTDHGPAPHELLAATLAACAATTVAMYARKRGWDIGELAVDADYDPDSAPRRVALELHLSDDLKPEQRRRLERVAEACPARRALEAGFVFE
jgi:putative redox protein